MRRLLQPLIMAILVSVSTFSVHAEFYYRGIWYTEISEHEVVTRPGDYNNNYRGNDVKGDVVIPEVVNNTFSNKSYRVVGIGKNSFYNCSEMTSISIPNTVTEICELAFAGCGISEIEIPDGVSEIGVKAFGDCHSLSKVNIPQTLTEIGEWVFSDCTSLKSIYIPETVTSIGAHAFYASGIEDIVIPNSVTEIGNEALARCQELTSVKLPDEITKISRSMFSKCTKLENIELPDKITVICEYAFSYCESLTEICIPNSVNRIEPDAFICSALEKVDIPASVTYIGEGAFYLCRFSSIVIPGDVSYIGRNAFNSEYLRDVTYLTSNPLDADYNYFSSDTTQYGTLIYLDGYLDVYQSRCPWYYFRNLKFVSGVNSLECVCGGSLPDVYSLDGICIMTNATKADIGTLSPGIYIIGDKKVYIK